MSKDISVRRVSAERRNRKHHPIRVASTLLLLSGTLPPTVSAADLLTTHRISAALANEAVGAAVAACASQGYSESSVLVDADGVAQASLRGDGAGAHTVRSASDKAYTSASLKSDTSVLVTTATPQLTPGGPFTKVPHLLLFGGGVVIKVGEETIGAIGAGGAPGGNLDDRCARAGLDKIKDRLK